MGKKREAIKAVERADVKTSRRVSEFKDSPPVQLLKGLGKMTDQPPLFAFAAGIGVAGLIRRDPRILRTAARMAAVHWLGMIAKDAVKRQIDRTRPQMLIEEGRYSMRKGQSPDKALSSFPSGHTVGATAIAGALLSEYPQHWKLAYGAVGAAALSRIAACDHFVSDTAAGAAIGAAAEKAVDVVVALIYRPGRQDLPSNS
jgi:membrane-associated phospholipid phosphatase